MASILDYTLHDGLLAVSVDRSRCGLGDQKINQVDSYTRTRRSSSAVCPHRTNSTGGRAAGIARRGRCSRREARGESSLQT
jgi:hypothetical protein